MVKKSLFKMKSKYFKNLCFSSALKEILRDLIDKKETYLIILFTPEVEVEYFSLEGTL